MNESMNKRMNEWMNGWVDEWMNGLCWKGSLVLFEKSSCHVSDFENWFWTPWCPRQPYAVVIRLEGQDLTVNCSAEFTDYGHRWRFQGSRRRSSYSTFEVLRVTSLLSGVAEYSYVNFWIFCNEDFYCKLQMKKKINLARTRPRLH